MQKTKKAFSLIEVLVSVSILSITVFGVYKLIGENTKLISNSDNYVQLNSLFYPLEECINYLDFDTDFPNKANGKIYNFNFGADNNDCLTGNENLVTIDNINYNLSGEITNFGDDFIDFELKISADGVGENKQIFKKIK